MVSVFAAILLTACMERKLIFISLKNQINIENRLKMFYLLLMYLMFVK